MRTAARVIVLGWVLGLPFVTFARVVVWHSDETLWADAVRKAPEKARPIMNLGRAHELRGDVTFADTAYRKAIALSFDPRRSDYDMRFTQAAAETNLAHLAMKAGNLAIAMRILDTTLRQWPTFPYAHYNRGTILKVVGACEESATEYGLALRLAPDLPQPIGECVQATGTDDQ